MRQWPTDDEVTELLEAFRIAMSACDMCSSTDQVERLVRLVHGYTRTDWIHVAALELVVSGELERPADA